MGTCSAKMGHFDVWHNLRCGEKKTANGMKTQKCRNGTENTRDARSEMGESIRESGHMGERHSVGGHSVGEHSGS